MEHGATVVGGNENSNTETVCGLILYTYPCNLPRAQERCQPQGDLLSTPMACVCACVCVREGERQTHRVNVNDVCLLLLTSWWIATGLGKCLVQRMSGVRKAVSSFTVTQPKQMCKHISIQMPPRQLYLSQDVIIIYFNSELRNPWELWHI